MSSPHGLRVKQLFQEASELKGAARERFLAEQCGNDAALRAAVEELLRLDEMVDDGFLRGVGTTIASTPVGQALPTGDSGADPSVPPTLDRFAGYTPTRVLGEGGMGVVYEARQDNPPRLVALKVIREGRVAPEHLRRFRLESEVLAQLQHPCIAQIYGSGASESGRPFFAMELIRGQPITAYLRTASLPIRAKLELFTTVCDAVQHAHDRGVIHRDIKPSNVMVIEQDGRALPKIIDFGIAKATLDADQSLTQSHQFIGTPAYMSPEQVSGDTPDARTDVYALGVLLYEILAGRLPYRLENCSIHEAARIIREEEPSRLITSVSFGRSDEKVRSIERIDRDIETIVLKTLEKDRSHRYASAAALADDIRRYLRDEPIVARPASTWYQARKFAKRHKELVFGLTLTFVALLGGLVATSYLALSEASLRRVADQRSADAQRAAYRASIAAAAEAIQNHDVASARRHLSMAPEALRGWEWRLFAGRLDQSMLQIPDEASSYMYKAWQRIVFLDTQTLASIREVATNEARAWRITDGSPAPVTVRSAAPPGAIAAFSPSLSAEIWCTPESVVTTRRFADDGLRTLAIGPHLGDGTFVSSIAVSDNGAIGLAILAGKRLGVCRIDLEHGTVECDERVMYRGDAILIGDRAARYSTEYAVPIIDMGDKAIELRGHTGFVHALAGSPDARRVVTGARDTTIRLWDIATGAQLAIGRGHTETVTAIAFSPDGRFIASGGVDRTVRIWNADTLEPLRTFHGHDAGIVRICYSPDGERIATIDLTNRIRVWDADGGEADNVLRGHTSFVYPVAISPDSKLIASAAWDQKVKLWDARSRREIASASGFSQVPNVLQFAPDGQTLIGLGVDNVNRVLCRMWSVPELTPIAAVPMPNKRLLMMSVDRVLFVDALIEESVIALDFSGNTLPAGNLIETLRGRQVTPDAGSFVATFVHAAKDGDASGTLRLYRRDNGWPMGTIASNWSAHFAWKPTQTPPRLVAVPLPESTPGVTIWDVEAQRELARLKGHSEIVYAVAWSPDGSRIATAGRDQVIRIWDGETFEEVAQLRGHSSYVWALEWSPDGTFLVSSSGDGTVRVWSAQ